MKQILVFSYRLNKIPALPILDCRGMRNPHNDKTITDAEKRASVSQEPIAKVLMNAGLAMLAQVDVIGVGCTHGKHRSVAVAQAIAGRYWDNKEEIEIIYESIEKHDAEYLDTA